MPLSDYLPTSWVNAITRIDSTRLNKIETGIDEVNAAVRTLESNPTVLSPDVEVLLAEGNAATGDMLPGGLRWHGAEVQGLLLHADTAPVGSSLVVQTKVGSTVLATATLPAGQTNVGSNVTFTPVAGDRLRFNATSVGSTTPATGVTLSLLAQPANAGYVNLLTANQANGISGVSVQNGSWASDAVNQYGGQNTFKVTAVSTAQESLYFATPKTPITAAFEYSMELYAKASAGSSPTRLVFYFYNASDAYVDASIGSNTTISDTAYHQLRIGPVTAPAGATQLLASWVTDTPTNGATYNLGAPLLIAGSFS